jgi:membrane protein
MARTLNPKAALRSVRDYGRSRPYHLVPWIALIAAGVLWPHRKEPPPGLSEDRCMTPEAFEEAEPGRGRSAHHPHHIPLLGWKDIAWRTYREMGRDQLPIVAAGITYYVLLAIFPAIGAFVSLYGLFADVATVQSQLQTLSLIIPATVLQVIGEQMMRLAGAHGAKLSAAFVVSVLLSIWSANAGMKALFNGLNATYDEIEKRDYVRRTALTYWATFTTLSFFILVTFVLVAVPPALKSMGLAQFDLYWIPLRWVLVFIITTAAFALAYRYGPSRAKAKWRWVTWGAVFGAAAWLLGSLGFSTYINHIRHLDATYGPLGTVMAFMVWVWFSTMALLLGAELNAEIEHQTAVDSTTGLPLPMGERGAAMADTVGYPFSFRGAVRYGAGVIRRQTTTLWGQFNRAFRRGSLPATPVERPDLQQSGVQSRRPAPPPP